MSEASELLALRKEILLARSSLYRLRIAHELTTVRESMRWPRVGLAVASSPPARSAVLGLLVLIAGHGRVARLLRAVAGALALAKLVSTLAALAKR